MGRKRKLEAISNVSNQNESSNSSTSSLSVVQRSAANDRERTRMRVLSKAFVRLKTSLPWVPSDTKLSKLDTLKLASSYISYLTQILQEDENNNSTLCTNFETSYNSSKMIPSIRLTPVDMQKIINEHLSSQESFSSNFANEFMI